MYRYRFYIETALPIYHVDLASNSMHHINRSE